MAVIEFMIMHELHQPLSEIRKMSVSTVMGLMTLLDEHGTIMKERSENASR